MDRSLGGLITYCSDDSDGSPDDGERYPGPQQENVCDPQSEKEADQHSIEEGQREEIEVDEAKPLPVHPVSPENSPSKRRSAYCAQMSDLSEHMRAFLSDVRRFFTQKVNFERGRPALSPTTYDKAQERMLCKFFFVFLCVFFG